jgi:hypothetical protein
MHLQFLCLLINSHLGTIDPEAQPRVAREWTDLSPIGRVNHKQRGRFRWRVRAVGVMPSLREGPLGPW